MADRTCIGHGDTEGRCGRVITEDDLKLNASGLWCRQCEEARRARITKQIQAIRDSFDQTERHAEGERERQERGNQGKRGQ